MHTNKNSRHGVYDPNRLVFDNLFAAKQLVLRGRQTIGIDVLIFKANEEGRDQ